ncbi:MAG TPA: hypothetical protein DCS93_22965 [Microscillaceae bacterium]|nr:hypothetical protein [Microscillaceae bacterium]
MRKIFLSGLLLLTLLVPGYAIDWSTNMPKAQAEAKASGKLILLNFAGSDWCSPCIQMKKKIFAAPAFEQFADKNLILVRADFPRKRKNRLAKDQIKHNEALAEKYNRQGVFPLTLLINAQGKVMKTWEGLPRLTPDAFVAQIKPLVKKQAPKNTETGSLNNSLKLDETHGMRVFKKTLLLMGSRFEVIVVDQNQVTAQHHIHAAIAEIKRIEQLISSWDKQSQTSAINRAAGLKSVMVDTELISLIERANRVSKLTQGAFDISFGSIDKSIWHFDGSLKQLPDAATAKKAVRLIDYRNIVIDKVNGAVFLKNKGMRIGFGAIGKGYAAERAKALLQKRGVKNGIINAGGDLAAWGNQPNGKPWTIGIANPNFKNQAFARLAVKNQAVVTSGNYEKFVVIDGKKYTHIIDPRTGYPVTGLKSVTIICPNAELADALATSVFVLGKEVGLDLVNQLNGVEAILVDDAQKVHYSKNIPLQDY